MLMAALVIVAGPALAQSKSDAKKDPNRKICDKFEETGSRLGGTRVCMTAQQWDEQRRTQRADVERAQQNSGIKTSN
jgi:hypothetical protein